ncbi:DUF5667 domain-containing protein [Blastococcus deserti]|uniref:DUF5667 domain-containing protein n=1 Tax=Blastococcus deserti TaxID=2259033 RepID=A0ABW4X3Y2_9ACTN
MSVHDGSRAAREELVVARLRELAPHLDGEPDPAFRAATRARLVAMAAVRSPAPAPVPRLQRLLAARAPDAAPARWRTRLTAGLAGAALTVTAAAALVAVADGARPGDVLYDLKRGTEQTQLALAGDARGRTLLDFASTRLDELEELVGEGGTALPAAAPAAPADAGVGAATADPALVLETIETMDQQTVEGAVWLTDRAVETSDGRPLDHLGRWAAGQADDLAVLQPLVPDAATEAVGRSLDLLARIGARADGLEAALDCPAGPAVGGSDDLGPLPVACTAPEATPPGSAGESSSGGTVTPGGSPGTTGPATPTAPPAAGTALGGSGPTGTGSGGSGGGILPSPGAPTPSPDGGLVPSLPLPTGVTRGDGGASAPPSSPSRSDDGGLKVCLPPLIGC